MGRKKKWTEEFVLEVIEDIKAKGFDAVAEDLGYLNRQSLMALLKKSAKALGQLGVYNELIGRPYNEWTEEFLAKVLADVKVMGAGAVSKDLGYSDRQVFMDAFRDAAVKYGKLSEYKKCCTRKNEWTEEFLLKVLADIKTRGLSTVADDLGYTGANALKASLKSYAKKFSINIDLE